MDLHDILIKYKGLIISFSILLLSILVSILLFSLVPLIGRQNNSNQMEYAGTENYLRPALNVMDFQLQDFNENFNTPGVYYKRPMLEKWDKEQVKKFWIPVEQILLRRIQKENEKDVEAIFSAVD